MATRMTRSGTERLRNQFKRIMFEVLGLHEEHPIIKALEKERLDSMIEITSLIEYVDTLDYYVSVPTEEGGMELRAQELSKAERGYLKILLSFMRYKEMSTYDDIESFEKREFDEYRTLIYDPTSNHQHQSTMTRSLPKNNHKSSEAEMFRKSIKKDRTAYPMLKEDRQWDKWNRSLKAVARRTTEPEMILSSGVRVLGLAMLLAVVPEAFANLE